MNKFTKFALLATSVAALCAQSASAASSYNAGDLILSIRANGSGTNPGATDNTYAITLGAGTTYRDASTGSIVTNIAADLVAAFGVNWASRSDLFWSVVGNRSSSPTPGGVVNGDGNRTLYVTNDQTTLGQQSAAPVLSSGTERGLVANDIQTYANAFDGAASASNPNGSIIASTAVNNYTAFGTDGPNDFSATFGTDGVEGNSNSGITNTALDLYRILNGNTAGTTPGAAIGTGSYEGTFTIDAMGNVIFSVTPGSEPVVPEPVSTGILTACAFLGLTAAARRKNAVAA